MGFNFQTYWVTRLGLNKGAPRVWMQGLRLAKAGFGSGKSYEVVVEQKRLVLTINPNGTRVVSSRKRGELEYPIIDLNSKELLSQFEGMEQIRVVITDQQIHILPLNAEIRRVERLERLQRKLETQEPLAIGSSSHGGGIMTHALHRGLSKAGIRSRLVFANDIREDLIEHAATANDAWDADTKAIVAPMQHVVQDPWLMQSLPECDIWEWGAPCSGASVSGRAKRGLFVTEEHPEVGHLVASAIAIVGRINPAVITIECVVPYSNSGSAAILRNSLRDMGYDCHETQLNGKEFNALEHRVRWVLVAVTKGMAFDWQELIRPELIERSLSEVLEDLPPTHHSWSTMDGLRAKEQRDLAAGKGFRMQIADGSATHVPTLTKRLQKNRSTDLKIRSTVDPTLLRIPTPAEHARSKGIPEHLIDGLSSTISHELLGQSVIYEKFVAVGELLGRIMKRHACVGAETIDRLDAAALQLPAM